MVKIGVIGVGHLAESMILGFLRSGMSPSDILLSPRGKSASLAADHGFLVASDNSSLVEQAEMVILAVRPKDASSAVAGLPWRRGQTLISVCAGVPMSLLPVAPASIVRAMPLTAAEIGASPTVFYPDNPAARDIIARFGATIPLADETAFEIATVPAAIYGWAQQLMRGTVEWSTEKGADADVMRKLVSLTFVAAGRLIAEKPEPMQQLLDELVTPGGITELGLHILRDRQQPEAWAAACDAVLNRLNGSRDPKAS